MIRVLDHVRSVYDPDGAVLFDLNQGKYFSLNRVGAWMWKALEDGHSLSEIKNGLKETAAGDEERLTTDVGEFIASLRELRLIHVDD